MNLPNLITFFRLLLIPVFITTLITYETEGGPYRQIALIIFIIASISDALDGFLARVMHQQTKFGQFIDPLADKLLLLSGYLCILAVSSLQFQPPLWITVTIVFRDIIIIIGLLLIYMSAGTLENLKPSIWGKITTFFQMITLTAILIEWPWVHYLWYLTAALTIISCLLYIKRDFSKIT